MRRLLSFIAFAALILVAGCGGKVSIQAERQTTTGILPGEQIVVLLSRYLFEGKLVKDISLPEERLEQCIRTETQGVKDDQMFLSPATFRKLVSADTTAALTAYMADDGTQSPESLLRLLAEPVTAKRLAEAKVRYVVLIQATYYTGQASILGEPGTLGVWWSQNSKLKSTVLDLNHARIAGSIESQSWGSEGFAVFIAMPMYFASSAELGACAAMGKELARFISGSSMP